jgi:hypothetical protein
MLLLKGVALTPFTSNLHLLPITLYTQPEPFSPTALTSSHVKVEDSRLLPAHLNFMRLVRLWGGGGVYLGFSFLLDRPLPHGRRLVDLGPNWTEPETTATAPQAAGSSGGAGTAPLELLDAQPACSNEMLLQFPAGHDPLLGCALLRYDAFFTASGGVHGGDASPCRDLAPPDPAAAAGAGAAWQHPSIATLRHLHNRPVHVGPSRATNQPAVATSWYLGYDGVDTDYEASAVTAQVEGAVESLGNKSLISRATPF